MNFNVCHGFCSSEPPFKIEEERIKAAQKLVINENPDILVLTEACFAKENSCRILINYQSLFNFPHYYHCPMGSEWGAALLSKYPIKQAENYSMGQRLFFRTSLDIEHRTINLDIAHPHPDLSEWEKKMFFKNIIRDYKKPYILAGDFNSLSDEDSYDKEKLIRGFRVFDKHAEEKVEDLMKRLAIREIRTAGLVDTFTAKHRTFDYTVPTNSLSINKDSAMRVDYVFCSSDFNVINSYKIKGKHVERASDHYPIIAILAFL